MRKRQVQGTTFGALLFFISTGLAVTGCTAPVDVEQPNAARPSAEGMPAFSGPNAADYESAWLEADSDFVRGILEDEQITDQEWAEVVDRLRACVVGLGMTFTSYNADGSYEVNIEGWDADASRKPLRDCERTSGESLGDLRWLAKENPLGKPMEELISQCHIRTGVVGPDYTPESYLRDVVTLDFPYLDPKTGPDAFWVCNDTPTTGS